ncbi:CHD5-like protein-domain-containing protein [Pterulicium gracile]|uniref:CHD5-like protein-domain-containing protein n=1 Tax=Pterulicium gracile TaxID=1884261 RepID=A0A5C3QLY3_9AGAR|nr:CHD5-like protein-domain-containing protein [Pterula gracilis]
MVSLIITIFAITFVTSLVSWIGQAVLLEFVYNLYLRAFDPSGSSKRRKLQTEILQKKAELLQTSAQDEFAKWAKLRRSVDKSLTDLNKLNGETAANKAAFSLKFNSVIWFMTTGVQFVVGWWYRKSPVFYLPPGWFGPLEWWFALPFAPKGSVSVGVFQMACKRFLKIGERVVKDVYQKYHSEPRKGTDSPTPSKVVEKEL